MTHPIRTLLRHLPAVSALVLSMLFAVACGPPGAEQQEGQATRPDATQASEITLTDLGGSEVRLADLSGKTVLLDFWATWCTPCREQAKILDELYERIDREAITFIAVDSGEDRETVEPWVADNPFPYPVWLDPEDALGLALEVYVLPTLIILDPQGEVTFFHEGIIEANALEKELAKAG